MDPLKYQSSQKHGHYMIKLPFLRGAIKQHQHNQYLLELAICLSLCEFHSDSINQSKVKNFSPTLKNDTTTKPKYGIYALFQRQSNLVLLHPPLFLNTMTPFTPSRCCVLRAQLWPLQSLPFLFSQNGLCSVYPFCPSLTVTQPTTTTIFLLWVLTFIQFCFNITKIFLCHFNFQLWGNVEFLCVSVYVFIFWFCGVSTDLSLEVNRQLRVYVLLKWKVVVATLCPASLSM